MLWRIMARRTHRHPWGVSVSSRQVSQILCPSTRRRS